MIRILIVEDEKPIADLLDMSLTAAGYACDCRMSGAEAADAVGERRYDLILLDVMLPGIDGFELMEYLAPLGIPVIFITARSGVKDRVRGLKLGAEDYITKPFSIEELLARVEVVLRRGHKLASRLVSGDITVDTEARTVLRAGRPVELTAKEFDLLVLFLKNQGIALYRQTLYERVWQDPFEGDTRTVDLHVQRLRRKLGLEGRLVAVYKVGYRLLKEEEP